MGRPLSNVAVTEVAELMTTDDALTPLYVTSALNPDV